MSSQENKKSQARRLRRFYIQKPLSEAKGSMRLGLSETHHVRHSIRLKLGDHCLVTDGRGWEAEVSIREFPKDGTAMLDIVEITKQTKAKPNKILLRVMPTLLQKGKNDFLMEKAQELGVDELWPITSERCEIKIPEAKLVKTVDRWRRTAVEASKQSGCLTMVAISAPRPFKSAIQELDEDDALVIFHPGGESIPFANWLGALRGVEGKVKSLNILIGPEGGFTEEEIEWVKWRGKKKNVWFVELGEVLFKADTAFVGIVASLRFSGILSV